MECPGSNIVQTVWVKLGFSWWNHTDKEVMPYSFILFFHEYLFIYNIDYHYAFSLYYYSFIATCKCAIKAKLYYWPTSTGFGQSFILNSNLIPVFTKLSPDTCKTPNLSILPLDSVLQNNVWLSLRTTSLACIFDSSACLFKIFLWDAPRIKYKLLGTTQTLHYMATILLSGHTGHEYKRRILAFYN